MNRSKVMSKIKGKHTAPELRLRRALWSIGLRYKLHKRIGSCTPDIVFTAKRIAVFVDGCYWHSCPLHRTSPKTNVEFWVAKFQRNVERDLENNLKLKLSGWTVLRFWEHEINNSLTACVNDVWEQMTI